MGLPILASLSDTKLLKPGKFPRVMHDRGGDINFLEAKGVVKLGTSRAQASARKPRPAGIYKIILCNPLRDASSDAAAVGHFRTR